ncbi:MAG: low-specificity L-threonine aldolase [Chitinophagaceae bacterium]|nr:low-specificity L-threonine aldolase [Chitinophagaceae bacterium]
MIDYRSDTVTKPTAAMLDAMFKAKVGDDVFHEDPTINELEHFAAEMFGMEASLFCSSGTMTNQIAIKCHTQPGDEVICDRTSHIFQYEGGGIAFNSGCSVNVIVGDRGRISAEQVKAHINSDDVHKAATSLVSLENTSNRGGGSCYDFNEMIRIAELCKQEGLKFHIDGARLFNAIVAKKESPKQYGEIFDSISICLSKGLGAPVGSLIIGNKEFIKKARRIRKVFGGGMRQAGYIAAAGLYALQNNIDRLQVDHDNAQKITAALKAKSFVDEILPVETNIIIFSVKNEMTPKLFIGKMKEHNILMYPISPTQVRIVVHLDITQEMVQKTIQIINEL